MTADSLGGVWTYAVEIARALERSGVFIGLATMGALLNEQQRSEIAGVANVCVFESDFRLEWMVDPWQEVERAGRWLLDLERRVRPDMVHINGYVHAKLPWKAPKILVAHSCVLSWWAAVRGDDPPAEWDRYRAEVTAGLNAADLIIAPTHAMESCLRNHYKWSGPCRVIYNGRTARAFLSGTKQPLVLCAGRLWDDGKNLTLLENAARNVRWPVYAAGEYRHPNGWSATNRNVRLLGPLAPESLARWMAAAAIFVAPAKYEPFGLAILEAALSGCALILGDIASLRELWHDAALFVPTTDAARLAGVIEHLASEPSVLERFGRNARSRALTFSRSRMIRSYLTAYSQLAHDALRTPEEDRNCG
jgi:glycosyltransferase involved in cell wall biosynthesis